MIIMMSHLPFHAWYRYLMLIFWRNTAGSVYLPLDLQTFLVTKYMLSYL